MAEKSELGGYSCVTRLSEAAIVLVLPVRFFVSSFQHVAPVPERRVVTVQEAVARKMAKFRAKLGVTAADLAPASVALESSEGLSEGGEDGDIDGVEVGGQAGFGVGVRPSATGRRRCQAPVDIGFWKKETEEMMSLLGTTAEGAHDYPMTELKRAVRGFDRSARGGQGTKIRSVVTCEG